MNAIFNMLGQLVRNTGGRLVLGAALSTAGLASSAHAHGPNLNLRFDFRNGAAELDSREWEPARFEERQTPVWVQPVYNTVPGARTWVEPVYRDRIERIWRPAVTREDRVQIWVPGGYEEREVRRGGRVSRERVYVPGRYDVQCRQVVVVPAHYEDVARRDVVCEGHWQVTADQQVLVTPGHWETRTERVCVSEGHWEERAMLSIRP